MSISVDTCITILFSFLYANILVVLIVVLNRHIRFYKTRKLKSAKLENIRMLTEDLETKKAKNYLDNYIKIKSATRPENEDFRESEVYIKEKGQAKYIGKLRSKSKLKRIESAVKLSAIASDEARKALEKAIVNEKLVQVKLYMANALSDINDARSIPILISTLKNQSDWYRSRVNTFICEFGEPFHDYLPEIINRQEIEMEELIIDFAEIYISATLKDYVTNLVDKSLAQENAHIETNENRYNKKLAYRAAEILADIYPKVIIEDKYLYCSDLIIKNNAIKAMAYNSSKKCLLKLLEFLGNEDTARSAVSAIVKIIDNQPDYINIVVDYYIKENNLLAKSFLAEILSNKIEFFIIKLSSADGRQLAEDVIKQILLSGKTSDIINFMNINKDKDIENEIIKIIKEALAEDITLESQFGLYLSSRLLQKMKIEKCEPIAYTREKNTDKKLIWGVCFIIAFSILIFPVVYCVRHYSNLYSESLLSNFSAYVVDFNYYLIFYSVTLNLIYLVLLVLSLIYVRKQSRLWRLKKFSFLFKKRMLPTISIIAPAFNEEKTIIESANSLMNLIYPDYELIVVNDGSTDDTLKSLIKTFDLKRVDYKFEEKIKTKPVIGVYKNHSMPRLTVIDKQNGGKADSLNVGINASTKELFCGIDADSILEKDALFKIAAMEIDAGIETTALGGNILPANGCLIEHGEIIKARVPKNNLARLQTVEYVRAFMAGRLGWAYINSMIIVSGAFGLFRKGRVISAGGYLTSSGKFEKDTVGEDMELVVRICRVMKELKLKFKIDYAYNANCWTEVPEDIKSLSKQRYRWHRGLVEILTFHKKMIFNPVYGRVGMISMPYYFIFEMIGSLVETQGYIMVIISLIFGWLNIEIALLLFISTIMMGVFVSILSLLIAEKGIEKLKLKDFLILILYAILENFGPRQLFNFWRTSGFIKMLRKENTWGKAERKGFSETSSVSSAA